MNPHATPFTDKTLNKYSESAIISALFRLAFKQGRAIALWQLPGHPQKHLVIDSSETIARGKVDIEESTPGFLFSPFYNQEGSRDLFIKAHIYFSTKDRELKALRETSQSVTALLDSLLGELEPKKNNIPLFFGPSLVTESTSQPAYKQIIQRALDEIAKGSFLKVVPSLIHNIPLDQGFNYLDTFDVLCRNYSDAFVSLVSIPGVGSWLGASPEPIIEVINGKTFSTAALAGTQAFNPQVPIREVAWRQKEIEEQALVSRYIINCFKKIRLREFEEVGPRTVVAGNLLHLKTSYTVDMEATNFPQLGSVMLELLHPTSAVCGMPKDTSMAFLRKEEHFDREFYSGYLGPVNVNDESHLFVNLRCMRLGPGRASLYAGAGVTADSSPEKEWLETQLKCNTLLEIVNRKT